ncbi:uncharacterized protein LOC118465101 isoform X2 [Anopheles albimanus]|uniref:uncharacterized protein LOC118465101 isoform X2 n=1 Tax=Anopheles albimanus TaxID=7167 RepID=UPI00163FB9D5|nr:uncharacterized protein LOC118465101 isoform X2 [Anopheles albimanus]
MVVASSLSLCEGGHTCLPPKECCAKGCCYLYAPPGGAPRVPVADADHVLNMFFVNHWYFWCFMLAIMLALLCACSLWRKRRQLCGWETSGRHSQSEGDSAGSCYAPPQYSRCNSFHIHAPPPYMEVASKPDLYPLVFSYADPGKGNGANYLMVQYFRNYLMQPLGSMSGTSTVDSLSSSFICTANEANTLVPPPYSRAASPDMPATVRNCPLQRSASQQVCAAHDAMLGSQSASAHVQYTRDEEAASEQDHTLSRDQPSEEMLPDSSTSINNSMSCSNVCHSEPITVQRAAHYCHSSIDRLGDKESTSHGVLESANTFSRTPDHDEIVEPNSRKPSYHSQPMNRTLSYPSPPTNSLGTFEKRAAISGGSHLGHYSSCLDNAHGSHGLHSKRGNLAQRHDMICKLCNLMGNISGSVPVELFRQIQPSEHPVQRKSIETCCDVLAQTNAAQQYILQQHQCPSQQQRNQAHQQYQQKHIFEFSGHSDDSMMIEDTGEKTEAQMRSSCIGSCTGSNVSSLLNIDSLHSPPRATSPTAEVRELLEQIRQLHDGNQQRHTEEPQDQSGTVPMGSDEVNGNAPLPSNRRPSSLISKRSKLFNKYGVQCMPSAASSGSSRAMYIPIASTPNAYIAAPSAVRCHLRSPSSMSSAATSFLSRGRSRYSWMSKSAPTTPGTVAPGGAGPALCDNSPLLLNEQDEDGEQNM